MAGRRLQVLRSRFFHLTGARPLIGPIAFIRVANNPFPLPRIAIKGEDRMNRLDLFPAFSVVGSVGATQPTILNRTLSNNVRCKYSERFDI